MKTAPGVIFYRYAWAKEFKEIHLFARGQPNHLHKFLRACDRRNSMIELMELIEEFLSQQQKKDDLRKLGAQQVIPPEVHAWFASLTTSKKARDRLLEPQMTMINANQWTSVDTICFLFLFCGINKWTILKIVVRDK